MRAFVLVALVGCGGARATTPMQQPTRPGDAGIADAEIATEAEIIEAGPSGDDVTCEKARAAFEVAIAPRIDACLMGLHKTIPMELQMRIDSEGRVSTERAAVNIYSTGYGSKAAFCVVAAARTTPFREPACAGRALDVQRAYPSH